MLRLPALAHRFRFLGAMGAWGLFVLASPGVLRADGFALVAALGVGLWGHVEARPYKGKAWKGFLAHALGALPGAAGLMVWIHHVYAPPLAYIGLGMGLYSAAGGLLLRRLTRALAVSGPGGAARLPLAIALAWTAMETLRSAVPMPFGLGWMRVGYHAHEWLWLAGSARLWGVAGLTFVLASLGGLAAALYRGRRAALAPTALLSGLGPLVLGTAAAALTSAPDTEDGPRVLVIQPGFSQARKQWDVPAENFAALVDLTRAALTAEREAGFPEPDLVAWGESMLYVLLFEEGVAELADGSPGRPGPRDLIALRTQERAWVHGRVLPGRGLLAPGTSFLAGAEVLVAHEGELRRVNGAVIYDPGGLRSAVAAKRYLVPGAETMYGLERVGPIRAFIEKVSGYIPDFLAAEATAVLPLGTRDGRRYGVATTVCFDNAHLAPYSDPVASGAVDFHVVVSNEAWYEESFEVDQMVAFSRIAALASGRSMVRATNSGISLVLGPDGRELGRVTEDGRDRMVQGHLAVTVPVPVGGGRGAPRPPIVVLRPWLAAAWVLVPLLLALFRRSSGGNPLGPAG